MSALALLRLTFDRRRVMIALADPASRAREANTGVLSGTLGFLAIGCPICNKLVVGLLGVSGALQYFGPVQPVLGVLAIGFALWALRVRLRAMTQGCPVPMAS